MDVINKIIKEKELILDEFNKLEEMKYNVCILEQTLKFYGSKEEVMNDINQLQELLNPITNEEYNTNYSEASDEESETESE